MFSIAPLLLIAIAIAGLVFGQEAARGNIVHEIEGTVGRPAGEAIQTMLSHTSSTGGSITATVVGVVILLLGASGVFVQLQDALNTIWKVAPRPGRTIREMIRDRFLSFSTVLGLGFLLLVSMIISAALSALNQFLTPEALPGGTYLWQGINLLVSLAILTVLFALIFKYLPDAKITWHHVWIGAGVTAVLFTLGKYLIGLYLGRGSTTSTFGAAGSLVVILVWVYYSSQLILFGAEFTRTYAQHLGSPVEPAANAVSVAPEDLARQGIPRDRDVQEAVHQAQTGHDGPHSSRFSPSAEKRTNS
jgi:membrane protein